jgi:hypothetical protein
MNNEFINSHATNLNDKNQTMITLIQMNNNSILDENLTHSASSFISEEEDDDDQEEEISQEKMGKFFKTNLDTEAKFQLDSNDWAKLKSLQMGHRFQKGEWEDYFVAGMKQSNKYCVFAFKDHYVNQVKMRKRKTLMDIVDTGTSDEGREGCGGGEKIFTARGYCVFKDCSVKFNLRMNAERVVHVMYTGELKHSVTDVNGRYFRGKSRHELKEILKTNKPKREFMHRIESHVAKRNCHLIESGNVDYVGKTYSVYKRIASEAKDWYKALVAFQDEIVQAEASKSNLSPVKGLFIFSMEFPIKIARVKNSIHIFFKFHVGSFNEIGRIFEKFHEILTEIDDIISEIFR